MRTRLDLIIDFTCPQFRGAADSVFRNILVPLSGQYEAMLLRDIHMIKIEMIKNIPKRSTEMQLPCLTHQGLIEHAT